MEKYKLDLQRFAFEQGVTPGTPTVTPVNVTTQDSMDPTMKEFYDTSLLENARAEMIYEQFAVVQPMKGNKVEFRKYETFEKALEPLTEGVIPSGQNFGMTKIEAETTQHGDYTTVSDRLEMEAFDDVIYGATEEMGAAGGETYDTLTRNRLLTGNCVMYCPNGTTEVSSRSALTNACILTPKMVKKAATWLKKNKAPKFKGYYIAIIHPSVSHDLTETDEWKEYHKYNNVEPIFKGEIGVLHGVRFIETTEAKIWAAAGADGVAVYGTLFFGMKAYGILDPEGEHMRMIIKPAKEIGGPLEQFSTIGYKFNHGALILYQERMLRVESGSSFGSDDEGN